ncbi:hypothetical protein HY311_03250 [Candidatus Nomurabacteria bacterium]|nr:hypothetical protein [Candidatus Nomurabacteria bacterium]
MAKQLLKDMVKVKHINKKIIEKPRENIKEKEKPIFQNEERVIFEVRKTATNENKKGSKYMLWFVALVSVIFCFFAFSFLFSKAEVVVNQKTKSVVLNENLSASKDTSADTLPFDLVVIEGSESTTVQTLGEKNVSVKATGVAVIYNAFSSSSQALDIDTRLEGSNGKIYKTLTRTIVPGMSKSGVPGSVEVKIYGSAAGVEYNSGPLDFKIFGFKGTPKYAKIYGRSKGEITGGFVGSVPDVSGADNVSAVNDLKTALQAKLLSQATNQIPAGFVLFKDAVFLDTNDANNLPNITSTLDKGTSATVLSLNATLYGILFNEKKLTQKVAQDNIDKYDGSDVYIPNIRDLAFTLTNKDNISFNNLQTINFNLSGPAKIVWKLDTNKFVADLLGKSKGDFTKILSEYPNIDSATLTISPIWKTFIPDKAKNIKMTINYAK